MLASAGLREEPIPTPSICRLLTSLKLNSTVVVPIRINLTNTACANGRGLSSPLKKAAVQMSMAQAKRTLVKRLQMSNEQRKTDEF